MDFNHRGSNQGYLNHSSSTPFSIPSYSRPTSSFTAQSPASKRVPSPFERLPFKTPMPITPSTSTSTSPSPVSPLPPLAHLGVPDVPCHPLPTPPASAVKPAGELLRPTPESIFHQLSHHVLQRGRTARFEHHPLELFHVSPINFESFLTLHGKAAVLGGMKLEYDACSCRIIVYPPPAPYHDCTPEFLRSVIARLRSNPSFDTPARQRSLSVRETAFRARDGSYLVPDAAVVVWPMEGEPREWPTIVVEVANSQGYADVIKKVRRWFVKSHGKVEVALVLKFTAKDPMLDPSCFLEVWRCHRVPKSETGVVQNIVEFEADGADAPDLQDEDLDINQPITIDCNDPGSHPSASSFNLVIPPFNDSFPSSDHSTNGSDSSTSSLDDDHIELDSVAVNVPVIALSLSNSDNSLSSLDDDIELDSLSVNVAVIAPSVSGSDSSLSSLDDDEGHDADVLLPTTLPSTSATSSSSSSSSSSASTSAFLPIRRGHKREIYLSGSRTKILPVADPMDPETSNLDLLYSDFFGSDNVPEGRDGNEPVQLDLNELRKEIALLMKVTIARAELAKRHVASGTGGGGKRIRR